jgi:hypothetical protein
MLNQSVTEHARRQEAFPYLVTSTPIHTHPHPSTPIHTRRVPLPFPTPRNQTFSAPPPSSKSGASRDPSPRLPPLPTPDWRWALRARPPELAVAAEGSGVGVLRLPCVLPLVTPLVLQLSSPRGGNPGISRTTSAGVLSLSSRLVNAIVR